MFENTEHRTGVSVTATPSRVTVDSAAEAPTRSGGRCSNCAMRALCLPQGLTPGDVAALDSVISTTRVIKQGEALYRANDPFHSIYAVRAGSFKTVVLHRDGLEQVTGFHFAGDVLGLDGVCANHHELDAIAIEDSAVCIVPFHLLESLCLEAKSILHSVHRMMSSEIVRESGLMMLLGTMCAEQRLAAFLVNLSERMKARGYSQAEFNLRMTREEIGSYLGLKFETVSRMFSKFDRNRLINVRGKQIRILDLDGLRHV